jgi:hypothetical protein
LTPASRRGNLCSSQATSGGTTLGYRRLSVASAAIAVIAVLPLAASPAAAEPVLDANCPGPADTTVLTGANGRRAQTFTAQTTGTLVRGELEVNKEPSSTGDYVMQIVTTDGAGAPTNTVLASTTIPNASVPNNVSTVAGIFDPPASVVAGQNYAILLTRSSPFHVSERNGNDCPGREFLSTSSSGPWTPEPETFDLIFAVFVEPTPTAEPAADPPPDTTITKGPKDKTRKKRATFEFTGTDARAVSAFQCKLDAGPFVACTSPYRVRVKKGKHTFQVQAIDQAGNVDGSPATDTWKRKKKRKK